MKDEIGADYTVIHVNRLEAGTPPPPLEALEGTDSKEWESELIKEKFLLLIMRGLSGSLRLFPRAEVSLCFREGAGALKTQNVRAEYYDLKAACVFNKAVWLFCSTKSSVRKFLHLQVCSSLHFHAFKNDESRKSCLVCPPVLTLINKASQKSLKDFFF